MRDLVPWPGNEPRPPALGAWSLNCWIIREVPIHLLSDGLCGPRKGDVGTCRAGRDWPWGDWPEVMQRWRWTSYPLKANGTGRISQHNRTPCPHAGKRRPMPGSKLLFYCLLRSEQEIVTSGGCVGMCVWVCVWAQSCPTLCDTVDCSPPGSFVHGILLARILEWVVTSFSKVS